MKTVAVKYDTALSDDIGLTLVELGEVQLFKIELTDWADMKQAISFLTPEELIKAERFKSEKARAHFVLVRACLRRMLASSLKVEPSRVPLAYASFGKPYIARINLKFNVSHTDGLGIIAISERGEVGVDVEVVRNGFDFVDITKRWFSPLEQNEIFKLSEGERIRAFFRCWTRKEAVLKLLGCGLSDELGRFSVSVGPSARILCSSVREVDEECQLFDLDLGKDYVGSLAYRSVGQPE